MVVILEGATTLPPFQGELMLVGYFGLTLLHTQKKKQVMSELNLEMEILSSFISQQ